ncbi:unnamed protein product [Caenorhabditis brenneri]
MPSLLDMTDVPMTNILEQCDFKSVLKLRKVCHGLREFIDNANLKTDLNRVHVTLNSISDCQTHLTSNFSKTQDRKILTADDLNTILNIQNSKLSELQVTCGSPEILRSFEETLKSKPRPLQTERLEMKVLSGAEILMILPYLDSKPLKDITILPADIEKDIEDLDGIERILELDQFKNAVGLSIERFFVNADLKKLFHFKRIAVKFRGIPLEDLVALKEAFITTTHMKYFSLQGPNIDEIELEKAFGAPFYDDYTDTRAWFFKVRGSKEHVLKVEFVVDILVFWRINVKEIPKNAVFSD